MKIQTTLSGLGVRSVPTLRINWLVALRVLATLIFLLCSLVFIWQTSFVALDGQRYFSLFEDGMISMRYAWNLSHGIGLVWNVGEHVEGYSNLLMTLIMSVATFLFDKKLAVLVIQLLGIPTVLGVAFLTRQIARLFYENTTLAELAFVGILFYAPLAYWSLLGMETGLLTLLILAAFLCMLAYLKKRQAQQLWFSSVFLGLAFLTRNESILLGGLIFGYLVYCLRQSGAKRTDFLLLIPAVLIYTIFVGGQLLFRLGYYGQLVPNTYILKVTGVPLLVKLRWGLDYLLPFLTQSVLLLGLALLEVVRSRGKQAMLILFLVILLGYLVSIGGDAFPLWRILVPGMPFVFILAAATLTNLAQWSRVQTKVLPLVLMLLNLLLLNAPLFRQVYNRDGENIQATYNQHSANIAIGILALTKPDASIGVFLAGVIPYYADRKAVDFLGKSDAYIASLPAHLGIALPGHNKYDLQYSIRTLQPTYIERFYWWDKKENLRAWAVRHYVRANYVTAHGDITLILKRNDPAVLWDKATIIPWAEEK